MLSYPMSLITRPDRVPKLGATRRVQAPAGAPAGEYYPSEGGRPIMPESDLRYAFVSGMLGDGHDELRGALSAGINPVRALVDDSVERDMGAAYRLERDRVRAVEEATMKQHPWLGFGLKTAGSFVPIGRAVRGSQLAVRGLSALPRVGRSIARAAKPLETAFDAALQGFNHGEGAADSFVGALTGLGVAPVVDRALKPVKVIAKRHFAKPVAERLERFVDTSKAARLPELIKRYTVDKLPAPPTARQLREAVDRAIPILGGGASTLAAKSAAANGPVRRPDRFYPIAGSLLGAALSGVPVVGSAAGLLLGDAFGRSRQQRGTKRK